MDLLDLLLLGLAVLAALSGFRRGALLQLFTYGGLLGGLIAGAALAPKFASLAHTTATRTAVTLGAFLAVAAIGDAVGWLIGARVWAVARRSRFGGMDAAGGSLVAVVATLLASWFIALSVAGGPFPAVSRQVRGSAVIHALDRALPEPFAIIGDVRRFLGKFGFPEVFAGLPPAPAGPVRPPSQAQAATAFRAAAGSTVRIVGQACGRIEEGSGFVVAANYVLTNAHVVAGAHGIRVQKQGGGSQSGTVVLFDPRLDVAVLRVSVTPGPILRLDRSDVGRGSIGAVVGYPGGGNLTGRAAAVRTLLHALGRDIYGNATVTRDVYELQAIVRPGNSGGPFVLTHGDVAGVVFAASTTDPDIGYALTSPEVMPDVNTAIGRTRAVSTRGCT